MVGEVAADAVDPAHRERAAAAHRDAWGRRRGNHVVVGHGVESRGRGRIAIIARPVGQRSSGWPVLSTTRYSPSTTRGSWEIGRAHVGTPVTNAHLVCRLLLEKKKRKEH